MTSQSQMDSSIGRLHYQSYPGNVWVMPAAIFFKNGTSWTRWHTSMEVKRPYDSNLVLMWSTHACFKSESTRWNLYEHLGEVLFSPIELESLNASLLLTSGTLLSNSFPTSLLPDPSTTHPPPLLPSPEPHLLPLSPFTEPHTPSLSPLTELPSTPTPEHIDLHKYDYCKLSHQFMHKPFPADKYKEPLDGHQSSRLVKCAWNDMDMFLPYCADAGADEEGDDIDMCRWSAGGIDATSPLDGNSTPVVTVLRTPPPCSSLQAWKEHMSEARSILAQGHAVAILDYVETGLEYEWSEESLCTIASRDLQTVKGTIQKFLCDTADPTERVNCLDIVMYGHPIPYIISQLSTVSQNTDEYFETIKKLTTPANILLPANTMLIQPPGCVYQVNTLDNSICTGGHFLMLDSMHLTEITRIGAVITKQTATNASHLSVIWLLSKITIGILYENHCNVLKKPFISLARMILWPTMYMEGDLDPDNPCFVYSEESHSELKAAQLIARDILQHNNISVAKIEPTMKAWEEGC
ncbi:hypothetical protein BC835DRAFT_1303057 [Cytidiella melzeri]|nr:hypothetical protein BC835DRAFT_1303057 [Cytidiella melzeri]